MNLTTAAYCWYDNNDTLYKNTYGALYNWYMVNTEKLCPIGWHVTSNAEWIALAYLFGGGDVAGIKLKESGTTHWKAGWGEGYFIPSTNESGFTALPGGMRNYEGTFSDVGEGGYWWSSTGGGPHGAWYRGMYYRGNWLDMDSYNYNAGWSVRCLKD
jgi:uncharacterized protein (TIGR02145 family)